MQWQTVQWQYPKSGWKYDSGELLKVLIYIYLEIKVFIYLLRYNCFYDTQMHTIEIRKQKTGKQFPFWYK